MLSRLLVVLLSLGTITPVNARSPRHITLAAGEPGGNYTRMAQAIAEIGAGQGLQIEILQSKGSADNIELLRDGKAGFAIVQSDVLRRALRGHEPFVNPLTGVGLVTPMFTEVIQALVRSDLYIFTTGELRGKKISLGPQGSGTAFSARAVLEASGVAIEEIQIASVPMDHVLGALREETVDVAFVSSALPTVPVEQALHEEEARLLFLDAKSIGRLARTGSYVEAAIPADTYSNQPDELPSVGVAALLLARDDVDGADVRALISIVNDGRRSLEKKTGIRLDLIGNVASAGPRVPVNPAARGLLSPRGSFHIVLIPLGLAVLLLTVLVSRYRREIRGSVAGHGRPLLALVVLALVWLMTAGGLYHFEHYVNDNFSTPLASIWSVLVYVSGGFQARAPLTGAGEKIAVLGIVTGLGGVAWFVALLAEDLVSSALKTIEEFHRRRRSVSSEEKDHIVIVNWNERAERMIDQIHGPDFAEPPAILVIANRTMAFPDRKAFERCKVLTGDPVQTRVLREARVPHARSVTIVAASKNDLLDEGDHGAPPDTVDAKTIMTILAIRMLCEGDAEGRQVPLTAEILSSANVDAARSAGRGGQTEIVCVESFGTGLLTQCAVTPGLARIYEDLLTFAPEKDEIYCVSIPRALVGKTFSDALRLFADRARLTKDQAAVPIGVRRGDQTWLNPIASDSGPDPLRGGDFLFVLADSADVVKN